MFVQKVTLSDLRHRNQNPHLLLVMIQVQYKYLLRTGRIIQLDTHDAIYRGKAKMCGEINGVEQAKAMVGLELVLWFDVCRKIRFDHSRLINY